MDRIIETEIIDSLLKLMKEDEKKFFSTYPALPFNIYNEIEKLSLSKASTNMELTAKAKIITKKFHEQFKTK